MQRRKFFKTTILGSATFMLPLNSVLFSGPLYTQSGVQRLKAGFSDPPYAARPQTWWHWMNGNVTTEGINLDLEAMHEIGLGGVQLFDVECGIPHGPVNYGSEQWHGMVKHALGKASNLGLKVCFHNCPGWSSSGGPWITPETSMKQVVWTEKQLHESGKLVRIIIEQPETLRDFYRDIRVIAFPTPVSEREGAEGFRLDDWKTKGAHLYTDSMVDYSRNDRPAHDSREIPFEDIIPSGQIIDLSDRMQSDGSLEWSVPEGQWTVVRFGYTITGKTNHPAPPEGTGLECDKLSKKGAEAHWNGIIAKVIETAGNHTGNTLESILIDSYEAHSQNWTERFPEEFRQRRTYELFNYLPCITGRVVDSIETTERFLWDFRRTVADLFVDYYYGHFHKLSRDHGLKLYVEPYGRIGNFDELANATQGDIPMGEFWVNRHDFGMSYSSKLSASAAHVQGKKIVASETFTAGRKEAAWISHPYSLKALGDYFYCKGINQFIFHEFAHQPWPDIKPGMTMGPFGFQMNRGNTWWKQSAAWITYLSRTQHLLQQGDFVADFCYYFGENVPNTLLRKEELVPAPPPGHDYDAFVTDTLMKLQVKNGQLVLPEGMRYNLLVMPHFERTLRPEVLQKIGELVRSGAVILGPKPMKAPGLNNYPYNDQEIEELANELWGEADGQDKRINHVGNGRVYYGAEIEQVLKDLQIVPDFSYAGEQHPGIEYIHRRTETEDIYFISNQEHRTVALECSFRVTGKAPEIWNPETGLTTEAGYYRETGACTVLPLTIDAAGSLFVIFNNNRQERTHVVEATWGKKGIHQLINREKSLDLEITEARYGVLNDPSKTLDVKELINSLIDNNYLRLVPVRTFTDDPAPGSGKQLYVRYRLEGKSYSATLDQGAQLVLPDQPTARTFPAAALITDQEGALTLQAWQNGKYQIHLSDGSVKSSRIKGIPKPMLIDGSWNLKFPPGWGAPENNTIDRLISWTDHTHPDIQHFSGTATYMKTFEIPSGFIQQEQQLWLDLGRVYNIAEISLNGQKPVTCWKPPFRMNITGMVHTGSNTIEVQVTNLWPNRMIGDESQPDPRPFDWNKRWRANLPVEWKKWQVMIDQETAQPGYYAKKSGRYAFSTAKYYTAEDPLLESGLIGPVTIFTQKTENII